VEEREERREKRAGVPFTARSRISACGPAELYRPHPAVQPAVGAEAGTCSPLAGGVIKPCSALALRASIMIGSERTGIQRGGVRKVEWAPGNSLTPSWRNGCVVSLQRNDGLWGPPHATRSQPAVGDFYNPCSYGNHGEQARESTRLPACRRRVVSAAATN